MEMTKRQKIECLEFCIEQLSNNHLYCGLCSLIREFYLSILKGRETFSYYIFPEFQKHKPPETGTSSYWWDINDKLSRIDYCKKLINILKEA